MMHWQTIFFEMNQLFLFPHFRAHQLIPSLRLQIPAGALFRYKHSISFLNENFVAHKNNSSTPRRLSL
jgi:hypothetical protein